MSSDTCSSSSNLSGSGRATVIELKRIGKVYRVYNRQIDRIRDALFPASRVQYRKYHALVDVSLQVEQGQTVGIIGRNGSGKSTLLQVICGILQPSTGQLEVRGRISALLELGAGFNPEFTGRENVYFNGSILGLSREEIDDCFTDIESFAGIGEFIDRPVKTYSSGMYVRLAFAVAINVRPDILIVDEALSVGDTLFQARCFAKFREFQEQGVTILFVTHSMDLITKYCSRAFLLEKGHLLHKGPAKDVVDAYNRMLVEQSATEDACKEEERPLPEREEGQLDPAAALMAHQKKSEQEFQFNPDENRYGNGKAEIIRVGIYDEEGNPRQTLHHGLVYDIVMEVVAREDLVNTILAYTIKDAKGFDLSGTNTFFHDIDTGRVQAGEVLRAVFRQRILLVAGSYLISFGCAAFEAGEYVVYDRRYDLMTLDVVSTRQSVGLFDPDVEITLSRPGVSP